jgi:hypothetical protein
MQWAMAYKFANVKIYHNVPIEECIIVLLIDGIHTLVDVIIINLAWTYLVSRVIFSHGGGDDYGNSSEGRTCFTIVT